MPWLARSPATSASCVLIVNSSGSSPRTNETRQSSQSLVPRRTHSVQLMDNSILDTMPLSVVRILVGPCHITNAPISSRTCSGPNTTPSLSTIPRWGSIST